ncbi:MAG: TIGR02611 family protein [Mycobacteriales bacterium]
MPEDLRADPDAAARSRRPLGHIRRLSGLRLRLRAGPVSGPLYRALVAVVGLVIIAGGLLLVPLPGPGWLIVFVGLAVLASEFQWAARLLRWGREKLTAWTRWLRERGRPAQVLVAIATLAFVVAVIWAYLAWRGVPAFVPDQIETQLDRNVPGLG